MSKEIRFWSDGARPVDFILISVSKYDPAHAIVVSSVCFIMNSTEDGPKVS